MKIKFCGADKEVTGSAHLITLDNGFSFLLDCGLYQGYDKGMADFNKTWLFDVTKLDCIVLSHAHIDHIGRLPRIVKDGFDGPIYATPATQSLAAILLLDSAMIHEKDAEYANKKLASKGIEYSEEVLEPLYVPDDVPPVMEKFTTHNYNRWFNIHPDVQVNYHDSGHILGAASVNLRINENGKARTLSFSGDIGRPNRPILRDPDPMERAEIIITESTYGNREHETQPEESARLLEIIRRTCVEQRGKVIIPAFSVGRTQEIVYMMDRMSTEGILPRVPVYVDSPLSVNATAIYNAHPECYDRDLLNYLLEDKDPFGFNGLTYIKNVEESKSLNDNQDPCVIISASGMVTAGRIQHHIINNCDNKRNTTLIIGYCAPGTPGRFIMDGADHIRLHGQEKPILATVEVMQSFSAHGDRKEMRNFLQNQKDIAKRIFLVHGEEDVQIAYKAYLEEDGFSGISIPSLGEEIIL